jgi:NADH-quinone oxidoreductase subunit J
MNEILPEGLPLLGVIQLIVGLAVLASAVAVITRRNPVASIAWLVVHFVGTAGLYLLLNSQFVAAVQVLVYAGAIIVLFLFVIMLLQVDKQQLSGADSGAGRKGLVLLASAALIAAFVAALGSGISSLPAATVAPGVEDSVEWLARDLMENHLVAFEVASIVIVSAMAGVLVFTTRRVPAGSLEGTDA